MGGSLALGERLMLVEDHIFGLIDLDLPHVVRVRLADVDEVEGDAVAVGLIELFQARSLRAERRSSV